MFEKYTEKARRVILFARHEASRLGGSSIETEHLLLGLLRESKDLVSFLPSPSSSEAIRKEIEKRVTRETKLPTSADMPLSPELKRVLAFAAEEAERLSHKHIGTEHLLVGIMREKRCFAAELLRQFGVEFSCVQAGMTRLRPPVLPWPKELQDYRVETRKNAQGVCLEESKLGSFFHWEKHPCIPRDALVKRDSGCAMLYHGENYDANEFELVKQGWTHDHCMICWRMLYSADDPEQSVGYTNGQEWLCENCYAVVIAGEESSGLPL